MIKMWVCIMTLFSTLFASPSNTSLHLNIGGEPDTLDPRISNNINAAFVIGMLFQGLTQVDKDGNIALLLAEKVDKSEDGKTYTFHLRKTKWSDGTDLTASDFVYAWRSVLDPKTMAPCANILYPLKNAEKASKNELPLDTIGVKAAGPHTLVVELEQPVPFFLDLVAATVFYPIPKHIAEKNGNWGRMDGIVGNGPFMLHSWIHDNSIAVKKNPQYWDAGSVQVEKIDISMIVNETTALRLFQQGKLDWIGGDFSPLPLNALPELKATHKLGSMAYGGTRYCALNIHTFPFNNASLRKAFSIAANRKQLIDHVAFPDDEAATNVVASAFKHKQKHSLFPDGDKELAKSYLETALKELNLKPEELKITLIYENTEQGSQIAQVLQQQWLETLGITVSLEGLELKTLTAALRKRDFQMGLIYWMVHYNSPMDIFDRYRSHDLIKNYPGWENPEYTKLLDLYYLEGKEEHLAKAEKLFLDDMPVIPLFHFSRPYLSSPALKGFDVTPIGDIFFTHATKDS